MNFNTETRHTKSKISIGKPIFRDNYMVWYAMALNGVSKKNEKCDHLLSLVVFRRQMNVLLRISSACFAIALINYGHYAAHRAHIATAEMGITSLVAFFSKTGFQYDLILFSL